MTRHSPPIHPDNETLAPKEHFGSPNVEYCAQHSLAKLLISLIAALSISACSDSETSKKDASRSNIATTTEVDRDHEAEGLVSAEGSSPAEDSSLARDMSESSSASITPEGGLPAAKDTLTLIENMGFSEAESDAAQVRLDTVSSELSCLEPQNAQTPKNKSIEQACKQISDRLASVEFESCMVAKLEPTGCFSVDGFPILLSEFPPVEGRTPQGKILIIGGTHGDELTSVSVSMRWIEKLNKHHSGLFHWHMVPMMNPDGVLKPNASRTNGNGVDLNRNMPSDDWDQNALKYWREKGSEDPRKYPGEQSSSEPETRWLINEIDRFQPDAIISVHAPYGVVDFDSLLLNTAPKSLGKLHLNLLGTYPGSLGNYAGINRNIPVITLELPHSWVMPSEAETSKIWEDIVSWLKKNVKANDELASAEGREN